MKKYLKIYRSFCPDIYTLIMLVVVPIALFILSIFLLSAYGLGTIGFSIFWLMALDLYGDYCIFNDIYTKGYNFGILKCSLRAKNILKGGIIMDQIKRFVQIALVITLVTVWMLLKGDFDTEKIILMNLTFIFATYAAITGILLMLRRVSSYIIYYTVGGICLGIIGTVELVLVLLVGYLKEIVDLKIMLYFAAFLSFVLTRQVIISLEKNYERSFKEAI